MTTIQSSQSENGTEGKHPVVAELCRMLWMVFGPVSVFFTGVTLWKETPWNYSRVDGFYWGIVLLTVVAKLLHTRIFHGMTTDDKPATMADFWKYSAKFILFAVAWWWFSQSRQM